jgi:NADH-quinone oxidoreductase subunit A
VQSELIYATVVVLMIALVIPGIMHLTKYLGPKSQNQQKDMVYESGVTSPIGVSSARFGIRFYLVVIMFVLFDVEIMFIFPWAVNVRELGFFGLVEMFTFIGLLFSGLLYLYNKGALKWD